MARIDWHIDGVEFSTCNCDYSCPCQFESLPTRGDCKGFGVMRVDTGHFGAVRLDGLHAAMLFAWPGPIFEGKGEMQLIIDERADTDQRDALSRIMHGKEVDEGGNHWWVFNAMCDRRHETLFKPIRCEIDIEARRAQVAISDLIDASGRPIKSPATGGEHRVRIDLPDGIEFEVAEIGSSTTRSRAAIRLELDDTYGQFSTLHHNQNGIVR
ncbi:MAG: DUF1326 domain-containing protein, partial [Gammaproteobacteria bacterium]